jgi:hypothetical protein
LASTPTATKSAYDLAAAAVPKSTVTTAGDVIYATGSGAVTRLGIGTAGQVLTVNGGATAPSWATPAGGGGMTLLQTLSISGTSVTSASIPSTYTNLYLVFSGIYAGGGNLDSTVRFNSDSGANYGYAVMAGQDSSGSFGVSAGGSSIPFVTVTTNNAFNGSGFMEIARYAETGRKNITTNQIGAISGGGNKRYNYIQGYYDGSSAISTITFARVQTDQTYSSGTIYIYGVK